MNKYRVNSPLKAKILKVILPSRVFLTINGRNLNFFREQRARKMYARSDIQV